MLTGANCRYKLYMLPEKAEPPGGGDQDGGEDGMLGVGGYQRPVPREEPLQGPYHPVLAQPGCKYYKL